MAGVRLDNISKVFEKARGRPGDPSTPAVDGVSLEVRDGEFVVLVGPSGCGKTTVLRMIAGLDEPTTGSIWIGGEDVTGRAPRERDVAMVFQNYALYPHMSVRRNIEFPLRMRGVTGAVRSARVAAVAELLGLGELLEREPARLSGGQRQRVALARAIVREPAVFLFDEPLSNLDAQIRATTRAELVRLHRELKATMIHVTHDQVEALSMAQRMAVMREGRMEQFAAPMEVYRSPATTFCARFIGSPAINLIPGRVEGDGAARQWFTAPGTRLERIAVTAAPAGQATLGVRPEHLKLTAPGEGELEGEVLITESSGADAVVHVGVANGDVVRARVASAAAPAVGSRVGLLLARDQVLVFGDDGRLTGRGWRS